MWLREIASSSPWSVKVPSVMVRASSYSYVAPTKAYELFSLTSMDTVPPSMCSFPPFSQIRFFDIIVPLSMVTSSPILSVPSQFPPILRVPSPQIVTPPFVLKKIPMESWLSSPTSSIVIGSSELKIWIFCASIPSKISVCESASKLHPSPLPSSFILQNPFSS